MLNDDKSKKDLNMSSKQMIFYFDWLVLFETFNCTLHFVINNAAG